MRTQAQGARGGIAVFGRLVVRLPLLPLIEFCDTFATDNAAIGPPSRGRVAFLARPKLATLQSGERTLTALRLRRQDIVSRESP